jgi:hypothetical protein
MVRPSFSIVVAGQTGIGDDEAVKVGTGNVAVRGSDLVLERVSFSRSVRG